MVHVARLMVRLLCSGPALVHVPPLRGILPGGRFIQTAIDIWNRYRPGAAQTRRLKRRASLGI